MLIAEEIEGWKPMRETMRMPEDRKLFDDMLNLVYLHASEASMACSAIPFDYVAMGILFELYKKVATGKFTHETQGRRPMLEEFHASGTEPNP